MIEFIYSGSRIKLDIELVLDELELEANYLLDRLILEVKRFRKAGATWREAERQVWNWFESNVDFVRAWNNKMDRIISQLESQLVASPVEEYSKWNPKQKFAWVLGYVKTSHCSDCEKLSSMSPRTIKEWRKFGKGLPREGKTQCNVGCRCMLKPI